MPSTASNMKRLVDRHGINVTLRTFSQGSYSPSTGLASGTSTTQTAKAYFYDFKTDEMDGTNIIFGDRRVVLPVVNNIGVTIPKPQAGDSLETVDGTVKVIGVSVIYNVTPSVYLLHVRK